jgi:4-hydroxybenzoate polyprenyltransferase
VIVFFTQAFIWLCVVLPLKRWFPDLVFLDGIHFLFLSLSTVCIAAAGYIINDYFDIRIDLINKPDKVIIERAISRRGAIILHSILNVAGLLLALYLALQLGRPSAVFIQLGCTLLLWLYSTKLKRQFVSGNIAVGLLTSLTVIILAVFEPVLYPFIYVDFFFKKNGAIFVNPLGVIFVYTYFAFMLTWMREIIKDMEDFKGDVENGCLTMPIKIGLQKSVRWVILLGMLTIIPLLLAAGKLLSAKWMILGMYILLALVLPIIFLLFTLPQKANREHYAKASKRLKWIMVAGICSLLIYYALQYQF